MKTNHLPQELKDLVSWSVKLLGLSIKDEYGETLYKQIEKTRKNLSQNWNGHHKNWKNDLKILNKEYKTLEKLDQESQRNFAHSYTCLLELINRCESAYRSYRLKEGTYQYKIMPRIIRSS